MGSGHAYSVPEEGVIPETSSEFDEINLGAYKLATLMRVTDELLEDTVFDVEAYIAKEFALRLGMAEEEAFLDGDGNGKPLGLMRQLDRVVDSGNAGRITMEDFSMPLAPATARMPCS